MNNNIYLGDELQFGEDPFISGAVASDRHEDFLELCAETIETDTFEEVEDSQFHELGSFQFEEGPHFCTMDINEVPGAYAMDDGFGYEEEPMSPHAISMDPVNNEMNEQDWRLGQIIDEVAAVPPAALETNKKQKLTNVPNKQFTQGPRHHGLSSYPKYPVARNGVHKKARTLYPVKVKRIVPQQPRILIHGTNPYALQPVPPRRPPPPMKWVEPENWHSGATMEKSVDAKKKILAIPRDRPSNQIRCYQCLSTFTSQLALEFHEVERHSNVFAFECIECKNIYSDIREASKHIVAEHKKDIIPLLDSSIFGNGDVSEIGKKGSQRRISGMIWSFLKNHLAQSGKLTGTSDDNDIVRREVKAVFNPNNKPEKAELLNEDGVNVDEKSCIEETASINDLLKQEYIYGPSIRRVSIESVPQNKLIRRRYQNIPSTRNLPCFTESNKVTSIPPLQPRRNPCPVVRPVYQRRPNNFTSTPLNLGKATSGGISRVGLGVLTASTGPQLVKKTAFVQKPSPSGGATTTHYLGNVYLAKSPHGGTYMISDKLGTRRNVIRNESMSNATSGRKKIKVEMPPLLEHYAARDRDRPTAAPRPIAN